MDEELAQSVTKHENGASYDVKKSTVRLSALAVICILFFILVPPTAVPLVMLVIGFVMLGLLMYALIKLILVLTGLQVRLRPLQRRSVMLLGVCLPLVLLMLQSLGQLTLRDALTLGGLFVIGVFYVLRLGSSWRSR